MLLTDTFGCSTKLPSFKAYKQLVVIYTGTPSELHDEYHMDLFGTATLRGYYQAKYAVAIVILLCTCM